jgi:hypothetical protein
MVDNFNQIIKLMDFRSEDDFYFLQIIKRKKEHPEMPKSVKVVHVFYIKSIEELLELKSEIIDTCIYHNARAYLNLNRRSFKKIALQTMKHLTDCIISGDYKFARKAFNTCCGRFSAESGEDKKWIVDIDFKIDDIQDPLHTKTINMMLHNVDPKGNKGIDIIETKNGYHLITKPFNVQQFKKIVSNVDIHKDNPTILFVS